MYNTLAEMPWWACAGLAFVGAAMVWMGNKRLDRRVMHGGIAAIALAVLLALTSWFLESDREQAMRRTRELVKAVEKRDRAGIVAQLHPTMNVYGITDPVALAEAAAVAVETFALESASVANLRAACDEDVILTTLQVRVTGQGVLLTNWRLTWRHTPKGWRMQKAELLESPGINSQQVEQAVRKK